MADKNDGEVSVMKAFLDKVLDDKKSIHAPCKNAYKDSRDGFTICHCWRCRRGNS